MKGKLRTGFSVFVFTLLTSFSAIARSEQPDQSSAREVNFGVMELTPYGLKDKNGILSGYFYELAQVLLADTGLAHEISLIPLKRLMFEVSEGREDCLFIAETHLAKERFRMIEPIGKDIQAGILPEAGRVISKYDDLVDYTIGVPIGVAIHKQFDTDDALAKEVTPNYASSVKMLLLGRVSAIAGSIDSFRYYARQLGKNPKFVFGEPLVFARIPIWLACGKAGPSDAVIERLRASMQKLRNNGTFKRLIDKYQ
jgi:polar amino acid transport system substrate-binding protein